MRLNFYFALTAVTISHPAFATSFEAKVESGNTVIISGHATKEQTCKTAVHFRYTDPKELEKRQDGIEICPPVNLKVGESREMCRMSFPVTNIEISTPVDATCKD